LASPPGPLHPSAQLQLIFGSELVLTVPAAATDLAPPPPRVCAAPKLSVEALRDLLTVAGSEHAGEAIECGGEIVAIFRCGLTSVNRHPHSQWPKISPILSPQGELSADGVNPQRACPSVLLTRNFPALW